jgi:thiol-disulfide isomerase/thioredoxin
MRISIFLLLFSSALFAQEKKFTITAEFKGGEDNSKLYLTHKYNDEFLVDSAVIQKEKAVFKGTTPEPNMYWITKNKNENPALIFFVDGGNVTITGRSDSLGKAMVKAGKTQEDYKQAMANLSKFNNQKSDFLKRFQQCNSRGDQAGAKKIQDSAYQNERNYIRQVVNFIKKNPDSNVGGYLIFSSAFDWPTIPEYDTLYNALSAKVKNGKFGKLALDKVNSLKGTTIGYPALEFAQADPDGKKVKLSSFKGKYVLVDFWASWCGPCRAENPNVVSAYKKYHDKGFEIFGVSLDDNKTKWMAAVEKDKLTWPQVSDLKGWQNEAAKAYGVTSIPFNLLIDKEGKILAKGLRGAELEAALAKIFGE